MTVYETLLIATVPVKCCKRNRALSVINNLRQSYWLVGCGGGPAVNSQPTNRRLSSHIYTLSPRKILWICVNLRNATGQKCDGRVHANHPLCGNAPGGNIHYTLRSNLVIAQCDLL